MRNFALSVVCLLCATAEAADPIKLEHNASAMIPTQGAIHEMMVVDPRVASVVPLNDNQFHLQAIGHGATDITANFLDGTSEKFAIEVTKKRYSGKPDFVTSRGRALLLNLSSPATYVGVGNPTLVSVTPLEGHLRYLVVGLNEGKTNLLVISENGLQESTIEVGKKIDDEERTHLTVATGDAALQVIAQRPTNLVVANKQIASAKLQRTKDGQYGVTIKGLTPGTTDILVSLGLEVRPIWYTVTVE